MNKIIQEDISFIAGKIAEFQKDFENKSILITGANGIIASYLVHTFMWMNKTLNSNIEVIALVRNKVRGENVFKDYLNDNKFRFIVQDVSDQFQWNGPIDFIIHAASQASPKFYSIDPVGTLKPNVIGTYNLLQLAVEKKVTSFLFISSGEIYGDYSMYGANALKESKVGGMDPTLLRSSYGESKKMGENMCVSWFSQYNVNTKIVRPFHCYGPGMKLDDGRVFSDFVKNIVNGEDIEIKSSGKSRRAFCYLPDAIFAMILILLKGIPGEAYNLGNAKENYSILELAKELIDLFPEKGLTVKVAESNENSKIDEFIPNTLKLEGLGWIPEYTVKQGFYRTIKSFY